MIDNPHLFCKRLYTQIVPYSGDRRKPSSIFIPSMVNSYYLAFRIVWMICVYIHRTATIPAGARIARVVLVVERTMGLRSNLISQSLNRSHREICRNT